MFLNVVREKHEQVKSVLHVLLDALSNNNQASKLTACEALNKVSNDLSSILAQADRPTWLTRTIEATRVFSVNNPKPEATRSGSSWSLLKALMGIYPEATQHEWVFEDEKVSYKFDVVFDKARNNSNLSELFDSLIANLGELISTGEIDSLKAIESFQRLIETLSQNKNSSYFSTIASWQFARTFTKNYIWKSLDNIPGVQTFKSAFEKSLKEMDVEIDNLHKEISSELKNKFDLSPQLALSHKKENPLYVLEDTESDKSV